MSCDFRIKIKIIPIQSEGQCNGLNICEISFPTNNNN